MRITMPYPDIPGDTAGRIMARSGWLVGITLEDAVWGFGFMPNSEVAKAYGVTITNPEHGFLFVLATIDGEIKDVCRCFALNLPKEYERVVLAGEPVEPEVPTWDVDKMSNGMDL